MSYRVVTFEAGRWVPLSGPVVGLGTAWALARAVGVSRRIPLRLCRIVHAIGVV